MGQSIFTFGRKKDFYSTNMANQINAMKSMTSKYAFKAFNSFSKVSQQVGQKTTKKLFY